MCLRLHNSVFNLPCVFEYLDTMVTGTTETERKSRVVEQRQGGPRMPGPGGSIFVTPMFTLSWQCYLSLVLYKTSLSQKCKCCLLPCALISPRVSRGGEMLNLACKDIYASLPLLLVVTCHLTLFGVHSCTLLPLFDFYVRNSDHSLLMNLRFRD